MGNSEQVLNKNLDLLRYLTDEEILKIQPYFKLKVYEANTKIFEEGDRGDSLYVIKNGHVQISKTIEEEEVVLAELNTGMFFGEIALLLEEGYRSAAVTTLKLTELYVLNRRDFMEIVNKNAEIGTKLLLSLGEILCERIIRTNENIITYVVLNKAILDTIDISKIYI